MQENIIVSICNDAILEAGNSTTITSLSDNSQLGELCSRLWVTTVREIYTEHPWAFKVVRAQANLLKSDTVNEYAVPDGSLRILGFYADAGYQLPEKLARVGADSLGNQKIFCPHLPLFLEYITDVTSSDKISPWLRKCLTYLLASKIATSQGKDDQKILQKYTNWLDRAEENNATEGHAVCSYDDKFIDCR